jgi:hypothetical protein
LNVVVIVGSSDLSQGKSVQKVHQELIILAKAFADKFTNCKLYLVFEFGIDFGDSDV